MSNFDPVQILKNNKKEKKMWEKWQLQKLGKDNPTHDY